MGDPEVRRAGRIALLTLCVCIVLSAMSRGAAESYAVFLLPLSRAFEWDRAQASSVYALLMLSLGLSSPIVGRIFDAWGPGRIYAIGLGCMAGGMLLAGSLESLWQFQLCVGVLGGFAVAALGPVTQAALISRWFHGRLTTAIAGVAAAAGVGVLVFSPLVQVLIDSFGWRDAYRILGGTMAVLLLALLFMPWREVARGRPPAEPPPPPSGAGPQAAVAVPAAMTLRQALRTRPFWSLFFIHFFTACGMFAVNPQIVAFLVDVGFPNLTAATAFGFAGVAATVGLITFGWMADRVGRLAAVLVSYAMTVGGFLILGLLELFPSYWLLVAFVVVFGPSFGSRGPIISAMTATIFGRGRSLGVILGAVSMGMGTGAAVGATMGGLLHDWTGGYGAVVIFSCTVMAIPITLFLVVPELRRQ
ncbi:MAG: MFS transporter [Alphaproteobacteria bacterium]